MVGIDASIALALWVPDVPCSVHRAKERVEYLIQNLATRRERILIPTPALAELLVRAGKAGAEFTNLIEKSARFQIAPFDTIAAIEVSLAIAAVKAAGGKKLKGSTDTWAKVKFDHQIVAICKVKEVTVIYSDDTGLCRFAQSVGIRPVTLADLPLPPEEMTLFSGLEDVPQVVQPTIVPENI